MKSDWADYTTYIFKVWVLTVTEIADTLQIHLLRHKYQHFKFWCSIEPSKTNKAASLTASSCGHDFTRTNRIKSSAKAQIVIPTGLVGVERQEGDPLLRTPSSRTRFREPKLVDFTWCWVLDLTQLDQRF